VLVTAINSAGSSDAEQAAATAVIP
jgi:hypothetical protein